MARQGQAGYESTGNGSQAMVVDEKVGWPGRHQDNLTIESTNSRIITTLFLRSLPCIHCICSWPLLPATKERFLEMSETKTKHRAGGILRSSPTLILVAWFSAWICQSGRNAQLSPTYGRMC